MVWGKGTFYKRAWGQTSCTSVSTPNSITVEASNGGKKEVNSQKVGGYDKDAHSPPSLCSFVYVVLLLRNCSDIFTMISTERNSPLYCIVVIIR